MHRLSDGTLRFLGSRHEPFLAEASGLDREVMVCHDPATGEQIAEVSAASLADVEQAVAAAHQAFVDRRWRGKTPAERQQILLKVADLIERDALLLAEIETLNGGKLFGGALHGEIPHSAETFRYYAGWVTKLGGSTFEPSVPGRRYHAFVREDPIGVAALITPWNGALVAAAWKLAPALAAGCSCIIKPAELTPLTTLYLAKLLCEAGVPEGVVQVLPGAGHSIGSALVRHPGVGKVSFTGSTATGEKLVRDSAGNFTRLSLELGGKSPVVIFKDADLSSAIPAAADAIFANAGQVCVAGSRIYAQREVFADVVDGIARHAAALQLGSGFDPETTMGPLISGPHRQRVAGMVDAALSAGAQAVTGGTSVSPGYFYAPTVVTGADQRSPLVQEEVFGPVVAVASFEDEADALRLANDSRYGLAASVWTRDAARALRMSEDLQAGIVWLNEHGIPELAMPIGGVKNSGFGREHGLEGLRAYTETRSVMMRL